MEWSIYSHLYYSKKVKAFLLYSSLSNMLIKLDKDGYHEIKKIQKQPDSVDRNDEKYRFLFDGRFIVQSNENEKRKLMLTTMYHRFNPLLLSLTIAPTRACNFVCPYCYEIDKAHKTMSMDVQNGILDFVKKREQIKQLRVTWYGGEPTLSIDAIKHLTVEFRKMIPDYGAYMVTNGYYLDKVVDSIDDLKINGFQITLDGTQKTHDVTRHLKNGKGSFEKIIANMDLLFSKHSIPVAVRMNISALNADQYAPLHKLLTEKFGGKAHLYPAFVRDYGGGGCPADTCYDDTYKKAVFLKTLFEKERIYTKDLYPWRMNKGCMMQNHNAFVIGPEGELYKCWHHLGEKEKTVGDIFALRTVTNFSLLADLMMKGDPLHDEKCTSCVLFPSCYGGCTDDKNRSANENICIPAKAMLEDFLDIRYAIKKTYSATSNEFST